MDDLLREFVRHLLAEKKNAGGAGIVVLKKIGDDYKILALKKDGKYDLPKGHIDPGENPWQCANRETSEEASVTSLKFPWGKEELLIPPSLTMYAGVTNQGGQIARNPKTGKREHDSLHWLTPDDVRADVLDFLTPALDWAEEKIEELEEKSSKSA